MVPVLVKSWASLWVQRIWGLFRSPCSHRGASCGGDENFAGYPPYCGEGAAPHAESVTVHEIDPAAPSEIAWEPTS